MSDIDFNLSAQLREEMGTGAMRRLRHAGHVPGVVYGGGGKTVPITLDSDDVLRHLEHEAFYSHILTLEIKGKKEKVILRDLQRHPVRSNFILHMDLQRVRQDEKIHITVPFHFIGEDIAPGVKQQSGLVSHLMTEAEVSCLPSDLPEYIEIDISELEIGDLLHLSDLKLPSGVALVELMHEHDHAVVTINVRREEIEEEEEVEEEEGEGEGEGEEGAEDSEQSEEG